jgi:predicted ArsR family transcriptional regulator
MSPHQGTLFDRADLVRAPRANHRGQSTSIDAAARAADLAHRHAAIVITALHHGPASAEDLEQRLAGALSALQCMKRLSDLLRAGLVAVHDENGRTRAGRRCRRYRLAARGPAPAADAIGAQHDRGAAW